MPERSLKALLQAVTSLTALMATGACVGLVDGTDGIRMAQKYAGHVVSLGGFALGSVIVYALGFLTRFVLGWHGRRATESPAGVGQAIVNISVDTPTAETPLSTWTSDAAGPGPAR